MQAERGSTRISKKELLSQESTSGKELGDNQDLVRQYRIEVGKKRLLTRQQELALAKQKDAGQKACGELASGSFLTQEREYELGGLIEARDAARNQLVEGNLRFVARIATKHIGKGLPYLDLIQAGNEALIESVDKFDYKTGYRVTTFAGRKIEWGIKNALARESRLIRYPMHQHEKLPEYERVKQNPSSEEDLSDAAVAAQMHISVNAAQDLRMLASYTLASLSDTIPSETPSQEVALYTQKRNKEIQARVNELPETEKVIIVRQFGFDGESDGVVPMKQVAREQGIPFSTSQLRGKRAITKLREALSTV